MTPLEIPPVLCQDFFQVLFSGIPKGIPPWITSIHHPGIPQLIYFVIR